MRQWFLIIVPAAVLLGLGILVGVLLNGGFDSEQQDGVSFSVPAAAIGNSVRGEQLWTTKSCAMCHSYGGKGGTDAPPLDYMRGNLSVHDIAGMSGNIWNHLPQMLPAFRAEKIPFPSIAPDEMADLIAYLHGAPAPAR